MSSGYDGLDICAFELVMLTPIKIKMCVFKFMVFVWLCAVEECTLMRCMSEDLRMVTYAIFLLKELRLISKFGLCCCHRNKTAS